MAKKQASGTTAPAAATAAAAPAGAVRKRGRPRRTTRGARPEQLPVRAVRRAFDLLGLLGQNREPPTLSALARGAALPVSTVARLLATLEQTGFVRRAASGGYAPGGRLLQMGLAAVRSLSIFDLSEQHLRRLSDMTGETANLATRADADHAIYLRHHVSSRAVQHVSWLGRTLPLDKTAIGHALLGRVNSHGFAARRNTLERDVTAIAAPVHGPGGEIVAAFSITGPTFRISDADVERFGGLVVREARLASAALGAPRAGEHG